MYYHHQNILINNYICPGIYICLRFSLLKFLNILINISKLTVVDTVSILDKALLIILLFLAMCRIL
jgi:hypothetical protein